MELCICLQLYPESVVMWHSQTENQRASFKLRAALPPQPQLLQLWTRGLSKSTTPSTTNKYWHAVGERHVGKMQLREKATCGDGGSSGVRLPHAGDEAAAAVATQDREMRPCLRTFSKHQMCSFSPSWRAQPLSKRALLLPLRQGRTCVTSPNAATSAASCVCQ